VSAWMSASLAKGGGYGPATKRREGQKVEVGVRARYLASNSPSTRNEQLTPRCSRANCGSGPRTKRKPYLMLAGPRQPCVSRSRTRPLPQPPRRSLAVRLGIDGSGRDGIPAFTTWISGFWNDPAARQGYQAAAKNAVTRIRRWTWRMVANKLRHCADASLTNHGTASLNWRLLPDRNGLASSTPVKAHFAGGTKERRSALDQPQDVACTDPTTFNKLIG